MGRKCSSSIRSSYASVCIITAIFSISFTSLLYLKYPQQYINHIDFMIIKLNTTRTASASLLIQDLAAPYVNALKEVVNPVIVSITPPDSTLSPPSVYISAVNFSVDGVSPPPVVNNTVVNPPVDGISPPPVVNNTAVNPSPVPVVNNTTVNPPIDRLAPTLVVNNTVVNPPVGVSPPPVVNNTVVNPPDGLSPPPVVNNTAVNPPDGLSTPLVNDTAVNPPVNGLSPPSVVNNTAVNPPIVISPPPVGNNASVNTPVVAINKAEEKQNNEADDEYENESLVVKIDQISIPPIKFNKQKRMEWIKRTIPESIILESTPRTRKFEFKMQQYVQAKQCSPNIYMTWISSTKFFGKREMFSLESVIQTHPNACVIIISRIMATKTGQKIIQPLLDRGHMILTIAPDFPLLFNGTPAQSWFERLKTGQLDPGTIPITQNLSNLLRLVVLYKYGGIYFDTDMIILKNVSTLRNSIGIQEHDPKKKTWLSVNNAVLIFDKGHPLLLRFLEEFNSTFDGNLWGHNGPYMATRVIKNITGDPKYQFDVMSIMAFYPIDWFDIHKFFRNPNVNESSWDNEMFEKVNKESYGVHLWNAISRNLTIEKGSIIGKLISTHCIICQNVYGS